MTGWKSKGLRLSSSLMTETTNGHTTSFQSLSSMHERALLHIPYIGSAAVYWPAAQRRRPREKNPDSCKPAVMICSVLRLHKCRSLMIYLLILGPRRQCCRCDAVGSHYTQLALVLLVYAVRFMCQNELQSSLECHGVSIRGICSITAWLEQMLQLVIG